MSQSSQVKQHFRSLTVICSAIVAGIVLFAVVVVFLRSSGGFGSEDLGLPAYLGSVLNLVALFILVVARFLPRAMARPGPDASEEDVLAWHKKSSIVTIALLEGAAFVALVAALLTSQFAMGMAVAGLAVLMILLMWPRPSQIKEMLRHSTP